MIVKIKKVRTMALVGKMVGKDGLTPASNAGDLFDEAAEAIKGQTPDEYGFYDCPDWLRKKVEFKRSR